MASYAKLILIGNVGGDPTVKDVNGTQVAEFSLAVNERVGQGQPDQTTWYRVSVWRQQAQVISQYVRKGTQMYIEGRPKARTYVDAQGQTRVSLEVTADNFQLLGGRNEPGGSGATTMGEPVSGYSAAKGGAAPPSFDANPDDLPF